MKVVLDQGVDEAAWTALIAADPDATFFHDAIWLHGLTSLYPHFEPLYFPARDAAGRLLGGLPAVRIVQAGMTQLLSQPFGSYGTPLAAPGSAASPAEVRLALVRRWFEEARRAGVVRAHLVPFHAAGEDPGSRVFPAAWQTPERTHLISLSQGFDAIWFGRYDKENRTASRKAVRLGVVVAPEPGSVGADVLDALYRPQSREWTDHTPYRYGFLHRLVEAGGSRVKIWVARQEGRPVFAVMAFYYKETVTPWVSGSAPDARALCAGNLIHKVLIEDACVRGFAVYNFGSSGGVPGIEAFKVAFGGMPVDYTAYFHESPWFGRLRRWRRRLRRAMGTG